VIASAGRGSTQLIALADAARWRAELESMPHAFGHRPEYAAASARVTGLEPMLWSHRGEDGRALCVVARRDAPGGFDIVSPLGFAGLAMEGDARGLDAAWTADWRERGAIAGYLQLSPFDSPATWRERLPGLSRWLQPAQDCWCWDLRPGPEALLAGMAKKHRQLLHKWQREGAELVHDQRELRAAFPRLFADLLRWQPLPALYRYDEAALSELTDAPGVLYVGARGADGEIEAVTIFLYAGTRAEGFLNAATLDGRRHSRALYWQAMLDLRAAGVEEVNLGGGIVPGDGLSEFKERLGARRAPTLALKQVFDEARYEQACASVGVEVSTDGYFPAWRRRPA
jgi:hypothetical protein